MTDDELDFSGPEYRRSASAQALYALYKLANGQRRWSVANVILKFIAKSEGGWMHSATVRQILQKHHHVIVGAYSYGDCMLVGAFPPSVVVGRYVSIGPGVRVYNQNHPLEHLSMHPYFYEPSMGVVKQNPMPRHTLVIGHDAWLGRNAIVTPGCKRIGVGAVIGAGAIVTKDVDDFAIVGGNPAKLIRYRFPEETRRRLVESRWWDRSLHDIARFANEMEKPVEALAWNHPLLGSTQLEAQH